MKNMNSLEKQSLIKKENLNPANYFQSLVQEAYNLKMLSTSDIEQIQLQTLDLLTKRTERYTGGDSSSVKTEMAQGILQSTLYTIGVALKTFPDPDACIPLIKQKPLSELFRQGRELIEIQMKEARKLLVTVEENYLTTDNVAYNETISHGLPPFFHDYDADFAAHDTPASIDYPLSNDKMNLLGIEYIYNYLHLLDLENQFCRHFRPDNIDCLLRGYDAHYPDLLINIFEFVFTNALGCLLAGRDIRRLYIKPQDISYLQQRLVNLPPDQLAALLTEATDRLGRELHISDRSLQNHMLATAIKLSARLRNALANDNLELTFITPKEKPAPPDIRFEDSEKMDDDLFRSIAGEIRDCRYVADKIAIIKRDIRSITDLIDILEGSCIFDEEYALVFQSLGDIELALLLKKLPADFTAAELHMTINELEWLNRLSGFLNKLDITRKERIIELAGKIE